MKGYLFRHDIPIKKCAGDLGISTSYLYQLLKKERKPSLALAIKIEKYTNGEVTTSELIGIEEENANSNLLQDNTNLEEMIERKLEPIRSQLASIELRLKKIEKAR